MKGEAKTNTKRDDAPVERVLEAEPVENTSIEEMVKQMSATMVKELEDYKAEEKRLTQRLQLQKMPEQRQQQRRQ